MGDRAATEAAFAKADRVVKLQLVNNRLVVNSMEPRGSSAPTIPRTTVRPGFPAGGRQHDPPVVADLILKIGSPKLRVRTAMSAAASA